MTEDLPCTNQASCVAYIAKLLDKQSSEARSHHFDTLLNVAQLLSNIIFITGTVITSFLLFSLYRKFQIGLPHFNIVGLFQSLIQVIRDAETSRTDTLSRANNMPCSTSLMRSQSRMELGYNETRLDLESQSSDEIFVARTPNVDFESTRASVGKTNASRINTIPKCTSRTGSCVCGNIELV